MKIFLGVLAGFVATVLIVSVGTYLGTIIFNAESGANTPYLIFNIAISMIGAIAGGFASTGFGNGTSRMPAVVLAALFMVMGLSAVFSGPAPGQPAWYPILLLLLAPPLIFAGAEIAFRRQRANTAANA